MAKGAFLSVKRGKLGDAVGYKISESNNGESQGWRIYQPVVSNPQTDAQLDQRVKLAVVNNFYRSLKPIITRGWENHKYGDQSRRAFLRAALGPGATIPILPKGTTEAPPLKGVPVTYGSLRPVKITYNREDGVFISDISVPDDLQNIATVGDLSRIFTAAGYQVGDQVTAVIGWYDAEYITYVTSSFYIDETDTRPVSSVGGQYWYWGVTGEEGSHFLAVEVDHPYLGTGNFCTLISVSRDGGAQNLRSYAEFAIGNTIENIYYQQTGDVTRGYIDTYRKSGSRNLDWPQVPTRGGGEPGTAYTIKVADGSTFTAASTEKLGDYWQVVADNGDQYYVKCTDVKSSAYNRWLIGKSGPYLGNMWGTAEPDGGVPNDSICPLIVSSDATEADLQLYYFLVSQGFDARGLLGGYPQQ